MTTLRKTAFLLACAAFLCWPALTSAQTESGVGTVMAVEGKCEFRPAGATEWQSLPFKGNIPAGATVRTGPNSKIKILFKDESVLSLGANSTMEITEFVYDSKNQKRTSSFKLLTGRLRAIVSKVFSSEENNYTIRTPTAVAGVRGTDFFLSVVSDKKTQLLVLDGEVKLINILESIEREMIVQPGLMSEVLDGEPPSFPEPFPAELRLELLGATSANPALTQAGSKSGDARALQRAEKNTAGASAPSGPDVMEVAAPAGGGTGAQPPIDQTPSIPNGYNRSNITIKFPGAGK